MKTTLREIKGYLYEDSAIDCTHKDLAEVNALMTAEDGLERIRYSTGVYGINGAVFRGNNSGNFYVVTARSTALFVLL